MPPHVPRKRLRGSPGTEGSTPVGHLKDKASSSRTKRRMPTLYDDLDASTSSLPIKASGSLFQNSDGDESEISSLTSLSSEDFEDVPLSKKAKTAAESSGDEEEDIDFEDVTVPEPSDSMIPVVSGDLELTLNKDVSMDFTDVYGDKKGPSKRERKVRNVSHCIHVLCLLWHNAVRNSWLCDTEVQAIMISHLPPKMWDEVDRWKRNSGFDERSCKANSPPKVPRRGVKGKGKEKKSRDWGASAKRLDVGAIDMSHGDPLFRLMQTLASWWKQRFKVTAPSLRKRGYMTLGRLDKFTKSYKEHYADFNRFGERLTGLDDFRRCALKCEGSRDIGAQLFTALLRGIGLETRMVASLQPLGFGWNRLENADPPKEDDTNPDANSPLKVPMITSSKDDVRERSVKTLPITRVESSSDSKDDLRPSYMDTDDESVVDMHITPTKAKKAAHKFDHDMEFPHYWTEVLSPVTSKYVAVDAIVRNLIATNRDITESFGPKGQRAEKARQIMAYIIGFSPDGTAKDVTVRYLRKQVWPGRTKGFRFPIEKIPVYNRQGKLKRYEEFDWFKSAMSGYARGTKAHPITEVDDDENTTDLTPAKPEAKKVKEGEETLQYYKQSKEFVLQRHLKREEALKRDSAPVKIFKNKMKSGTVEEEDVFRRSDVIQVKSAETWHKQGRAPLPGEQPLKRVPYRAATLNRRREILEAEALTGEKVLQGLYGIEQTDWIIPPPIRNGIIPKNEYGNIDLFVEHMCPAGAVHIPYRGTIKACKRLKIDYAEAVVDFEFGHRMAVPVIQGVVVAEEHHSQVMAELEKDEAERARKEDEKRRKAALSQWRKFVMGLRIVERIRQDYGDIDDTVSIFGHHKTTTGTRSNAIVATQDEELAGGFLPEGYEEVRDGEDPQHQHQQNASGFFPVGDDDENSTADTSLIIEHH